jgi:hypothetical protein
LERVLELNGPFYAQFQFQPRRGLDEIAARFDPNRAAFLRRVFQCAKQIQSALVRRLRAERHETLAAPRQLARFLCGISSPAASRAKLRSPPSFGEFESIPFQEVLTFLETLDQAEGGRV